LSTGDSVSGKAQVMLSSSWVKQREEGGTGTVCQ